MSKKYRIGYLDEDEGYQAKFYQAFKNEFDIKMTQTFDKEVSDMCNLSKGIIEESLAEGRVEGEEKATLKAICSVMDKLKMTAEQAMEFLNVNKDDYAKYEELLKQTSPKA